MKKWLKLLLFLVVAALVAGGGAAYGTFERYQRQNVFLEKTTLGGTEIGGSTPAQVADALAAYQNKTIADAQFLETMNAILKDYRDERPQVEFPPTLNDSSDAQAIYGAILPTLSEAKKDLASPELVARLALEIAEIFDRRCRVDWEKSVALDDQIAQEIEETLYKYEDDALGELEDDDREKINECVRRVALARRSR